MNLITELQLQLQARFVIASVVYPQGKRRGAMARERLGRHEPLREVVSTGLDIEQDRAVSTRMYVRLEDHQRKMKAIDDALMWRSRRTYIAEALLGFMILVAIVFAVMRYYQLRKYSRYFDFSSSTNMGDNVSLSSSWSR